MEFRILGPLEAYEAGKQVPVGGAKQRALLAVLLMQANRVVASGRLIDALWEEEPPETARKAVQVYVSQLRKLLGPDVLLTRAPGYLLRVEPGMLDLDRFEALVREAREADPQIAADKLREALALFRGRPLDDVAHERFAQGEIARLEELRLAALEERIEAELRLGLHAELAGELDALVGAHPLRERLYRQRMLALYRCGRQAEALEVYQAARYALVEQLGIEPSKELRKLHQQILNQDAALELEARPAAGAPTEERGTFVGREHELAELAAGLDEAFRGRGRLFLLQGEPGIGKTRLADELMIRAKARRAWVLVGRCWEAGGAPAYWPWTQSLREYVRGTDPTAVRRQLGVGAAEVAQIIPELRELFSGLPAPQPAEAETARFLLFDSTASFLRNAAAERPLALVLDDLHAADEPSLLLLRYVASLLSDCRILIVGTFRDLDPTVQDPLESTLAELGREPVTRRIRLSGLSRDEVGRLAEVTASAAPPNQLVAELHAETDGNPLFVAEIVRLLAAEGRLTSDAPLGISIPESIREVIGRRLRRLSGECRRVLSLASVFGREFGLVALERVADYTGIDKLLNMLDEALAARAVEEVPGVLGRLRFGHALTRDTLYEEIPATHRARLHRRVAEVLEALYAGNPGPHLAELAHHFSLAVPAASPDKAIEYARGAGKEAARSLAYEEAARLYQLALRVVDESWPDDETRCELLLALGDAQTRAGDSPTAKESFLQAAEIARRAAMPERLGLAALGYGGRFVWARAGSDPNLVPLLEEALRLLSEHDSPLRARLLTRLAGALRDQPSRTLRESLSEEAVQVARRIGDLETLAYALDGRFAAIYWPENPEERLAAATEFLHAAEEAGDKERAFQAGEYRSTALLQLGDLAGVDAVLEQMGRLAGELRQAAQHWLLLQMRTMRALLDGRFDDAERLSIEALDLGQRAQAPEAIFSFRLESFVLRKEQGRLEGVEEMIERSPDDYPARPLFRCLLADLYSQLGREDDARTIFEELAAGGFIDLPVNDEWLLSVAFLSEVCSVLEDAPRAASLYDLLLPHAEASVSEQAEICTGSAGRYLGLLSTTMSRWGDAERHFELALEMNTRIGARPWLAHTQEDYARMLFTRGDPGDRDRGRELVEQALATYRELGMESYAARASALAQEAAVSTP